MKKISLRDIGFYALIFIILISTVYILRQTNSSDSLTYSGVRDLFEMKKVEKFVVEGDKTLILTLREPINGKYTVTYELSDYSTFYNDMHTLIDQQYKDGTITSYDYPPGFQAPWWMSFIPYIALIIIMALIWYFMFNRTAAGGVDKTARFGKARTKNASDEKNKKTFADVAGADEEKEELQEIVEYLRDPKRFIALGARIPKGVLLVGPPGTGKTLIAKAVAGEAGVQFLSISGSDFVELYVGVGASRVRDLFDQAKRAAPSIVFIDEIDAVGRQRGAGLGGGHDEREQTLNQLLVEMDGFGNNDGVIVIAATNRPDILDPALLRPGRFDRQVYVGMPDMKGRESILQVHTKGKPLAEDVDLAVLGKATTGFTGADLENLVNEGALLAARKNKRFISMSDLRESMIKVLAGPEKKSKVVTQHERRLTAYHEAGHAVVIRNLKTHPPVHQISIVPRGKAGGMTIFLPQEDKSFISKNEMFEQIVSLLGGRVAEQMVLGDISTGASDDIRRASAIARKMVTVYGMSRRLGSISFESGHDEIFIGRSMAQTRAYSEEVAAIIDEEVKSIIDKAYAQCEDILRRNLSKMEIIANYLLENETMDAGAFRKVFEDPSIPETGVLPAQQGGGSAQNGPGLP
ncbi:MAG: ATP-dependent zinc metalloprotease FtsH [Oscillospiraceae bacterium]|nr:ATP-dependent zinc metalloprotease FtsH [Oscillospiraceae bacterium]